MWKVNKTCTHTYTSRSHCFRKVCCVTVCYWGSTNHTLTCSTSNVVGGTLLFTDVRKQRLYYNENTKWATQGRGREREKVSERERERERETERELTAMAGAAVTPSSRLVNWEVSTSSTQTGLFRTPNSFAVGHSDTQTCNQHKSWNQSLIYYKPSGRNSYWKCVRMRMR